MRLTKGGENCKPFWENICRGGSLPFRQATEGGSAPRRILAAGYHRCYINRRPRRKNLPAGTYKIGKTVMTKDGKGKVTRHNPLKKKIAVYLTGGPEIEVDIDKVTIEGKKENR
jgi:hypothetical protein